jgi:hypothetical protein
MLLRGAAGARPGDAVAGSTLRGLDGELYERDGRVSVRSMRSVGSILCRDVAGRTDDAGSRVSTGFSLTAGTLERGAITRSDCGGLAVGTRLGADDVTARDGAVRSTARDSDPPGGSA